MALVKAPRVLMLSAGNEVAPRRRSASVAAAAARADWNWSTCLKSSRPTLVSSAKTNCVRGVRFCGSGSPVA
jgi:hypothetical protein